MLAELVEGEVGDGETSAAVIAGGLASVPCAIGELDEFISVCIALLCKASTDRRVLQRGVREVENFFCQRQFVGCAENQGRFFFWAVPSGHAPQEAGAHDIALAVLSGNEQEHGLKSEHRNVI